MYSKVDYDFLLGLTISDIICLELIGEEIYDEFDVEAANGTISSFVPSEHTCTNKSPEAESVVAQINDVFTTRSPALRPLNTRGLNFLRSTSAPPSPRNRSRALSVLPDPTQAPQPNISERPHTAHSTATTVENPEVTTAIPSESKGKGEFTKEVNVVSASENVVNLSAPRPVSVKKHPVSSSGTVSLVNPMSPASSPSGSPAPSLEAILLERKRRLAAAATAGKDVGPITAPCIQGRSENHDARVLALRAPAMSPKGTSKFKSSPLGGSEQTGVVIAEKVRQDIKN